MRTLVQSLNHLVIASAVLLSFSLASPAQPVPGGMTPDGVAQLLERLADPDQAGADQIEQELRRQWSKSGSPAMDLLLQRAQKALEAEDYPTAIEHLTALTDHAPDFAEGWNLRATAWFQTGRLGLALQDVRRTLALNPDHFAAMSGLGIILEALGEEQQALDVLRRSHALNPHRAGIAGMIERLERALDGKAI